MWGGGRGRCGEEGDEGMGRRERKVWGGGRGRCGRRERKDWGGGRERCGEEGDEGMGRRERKVWGGGRGRCGEEVVVHHLPVDEYCVEGRVTHPWVLPNTPHSLQEGLFASNEDVLNEAKGVKRGKTFYIAQEMLTTERTYVCVCVCGGGGVGVCVWGVCVCVCVGGCGCACDMKVLFNAV